MSETIEPETELEVATEQPAPSAEPRGPWQRAPGKRGRLSREERAAKAAWEGTAEIVDFDTTKSKSSSNPKRATSLEQISELIFALHSGLAMFAPELGLSKEESNLLAGSVANLGKYYNISIDGKAGAIVGLASTCGMIYGPRIFALYMKRKMANAQHTEENIASLAA